MIPLSRSSRVRRTLRRASATILTGVHLALAVGAGVHVGEHDTSILSWLPSEYHHHGFALTGAEPGEHRGSPEACVACHMSRTPPRLGPSTRVPAGPPPVLAGAGDTSVASPRATLHSPRPIRGPPAA